jgi:hypothetical protein
MLRLGRSDVGLTSEIGPLVASFDYERPVRVTEFEDKFPEASYDSRLDCIRIDDERFDLQLLLFSNGRGLVVRARHVNLVEMAAMRWASRIEEEKLFVEVLLPE